MPEQDEWTEEIIAARPRRRLLSGPTLVLLVGAVGVGGFLIGTAVEKNQLPASSGGGGFGGLARGGGAGRGGGLRAAFGGLGAVTTGGGGAGGGATIGQVQSVSGNTLYVTDTQGNTVAVHTTPGSQVIRTVDASARDVHPGEQVVVQGTKNTDGSIDAAVVRSNASASGALAGLGGGGGGAATGGLGAAAGGGAGAPGG